MTWVQQPAEEMLTERLRIVATLGRGGQGAVFEVLDVETTERYAVKLIAEALQNDGALMSRLEHEAITAAAIHHPNIVRIYGLEKNRSGRRFLRMERLYGRSLRELLTEGEVPISVAVDIAIQIARGLSAAHQQGIVHRDLKPGNIFLVDRTAGLLVKVMDFGIAKAHESWELTELTETGNMVGTPAYMSPEQAMTPDEIDARSDIYSLGIVLYEMLTRTRPFKGTVAQTLLAQVNIPAPDPRRVRPAISPALAAVVLKALEKKPAQRFQTMLELAHALEAREKTKAPQPAVVVPIVEVEPSSKRHLYGAAVALVASAVFMLVTLSDRTVKEAPMRETRVEQALTVSEEAAPVEPPAERSPEPAVEAVPVQELVPVVQEQTSWRELDGKLHAKLASRGLVRRDFVLLDPELAEAWARMRSAKTKIEVETLYLRAEDSVLNTPIAVELLEAKLDRVLSVLRGTPKERFDDEYRALEKTYISLRAQTQSADLADPDRLARSITRLEAQVEKKKSR